MCLKLPLEDLDLLSWLKIQTIYPKVYWRDREGKRESAAVGITQKSKEAPWFPPDTPKELHFYGGMSFFNHRIDDLWKDFPVSFFFLPSFEVIKENGQCTLVIHQKEKIHDLYFEEGDLKPKKEKWLKRTDLPVYDDWEKNIQAFLDNKEAQKIVLARRTTLDFQNPPNPFDILRSIRKRGQNATAFAFQMTPDSAFIGMTPERLYRRSGRIIQSEALAGTCPRGKSKEEDLKLRKNLINDDKEMREFLFVKNYIREALAPFCESFHGEAYDKVVTAGRVQHLCHKFSGILKPSVSDQELIKALHPTPAMGGYPCDKAMEIISECEPFFRGWYASPIGWVSPEGADIAVGIRSALIEGRKMHLFAGTGIVDGSEPQKEWEELEYKIGQFSS